LENELDYCCNRINCSEEV